MAAPLVQRPALDGQHGFSLSFEVEQHPFFSAMAAIAALLIVVFLFHSLASKSGSNSASSSSLAPIVPGQPVGPGTAYNTTEGPSAPPPQAPPVPTSGYTASPIVGGVVDSVYAIKTIRAKTKSGLNAAWDAKYGGVPVRANASQSAPVLSILPFGSQITVNPLSITGGLNEKGGSPLWDKVASGGYISVFDLH